MAYILIRATKILIPPDKVSTWRRVVTPSWEYKKALPYHFRSKGDAEVVKLPVYRGTDKRQGLDRSLVK